MMMNDPAFVGNSTMILFPPQKRNQIYGFKGGVLHGGHTLRDVGSRLVHSSQPVRKRSDIPSIFKEMLEKQSLS